METVTIRSIFRDVVKTKRGPAEKVTIYTVEYPDRMSSFDTRTTRDWKEGDKVDVEITKNGNFTNFRTKPSQNAIPVDEIRSLDERLKIVEKIIQDKVLHQDVVPMDDFNDFTPSE